MSGYLLVRSNGDPYGLPLGAVVEVVDGLRPLPVPTARRAVRGVVTIRRQMVPVVHLGALVTSTDPPADRGETVVLARCADRHVAFEVDDADAVVPHAQVAVPRGRRLSCASGIAQHDGRVVPVLDLTALGDMLTAGGGSDVA